MRGRRRFYWVLLFLPSLFLNSCAMLGPDFKTPEAKVPTAWSVQDSDLFAKPSIEQSKAWWKKFDDPQLDQLIEIAYRENLSLQAAGLRIMEARAQLALVRGNMYPQVQEMNGEGFTIGTTAGAVDRYYNAASLGFDAGWELDFWGKFRRSIESADANLLSTVADYDDLLVSLTAETANLYVNIRTLQERIQLAEKNAELQQKSLKLVSLQLEAGIVTELDVLQARTLLSSTLATVPNLQAVLATYKNAMAVLLAMLPEELDSLLKDVGEIPKISQQLVVEIPAELLRRRPDIRRSEMQTAAQSAQIGIARAELFPSFSLFGSIGWSATDAGTGSLGDIFDTNNFSYTFGPTFKWNLFHYGRLKNQVRIQDARLQQLIVNYQNVVLNAAREVEDAMQTLTLTHREAQLLKDTVTTSRRSTELSMLQYQEGLADYQRVLDSTRALTQKQDQYAQTLGRIATSTIALYKAFGGGWELNTNRPFISQTVREEMEDRTDWGTLLAPEK
jgi:NodT family efflux transporter outer membrane factor (OMF) lipoprotein